MKWILTVRLQTRVDCVRYFKTNLKRQWETRCRELSWTDDRGWMGWHHSVTLWWLKGLRLVCKSAWDSIIAAFSNKWAPGFAQNESWLSKGWTYFWKWSGKHRFRNRNFLCVVSALQQYGWKNNEKRQKLPYLQSRPCWAAQLLRSIRVVSSSTSPTPRKEY